MTSNADFKRKVRDRMAQTGERYMTARSHLLSNRSAAVAATATRGVGGRQADLAAVANALARAPGSPDRTASRSTSSTCSGSAAGWGSWWLSSCMTASVRR